MPGRRSEPASDRLSAADPPQRRVGGRSPAPPSRARPAPPASGPGLDGLGSRRRPVELRGRAAWLHRSTTTSSRSPPKSVLLVDASGQSFATIHSPQIEIPVPASDIPVVMRQAIVAAEDKSFYSNSGVDPFAIVRAAWRDISGASLQGGSTITQQYVKNVYTGSEQTALRKLREASLAIRLEQHLTKYRDPHPLPEHALPRQRHRGRRGGEPVLLRRTDLPPRSRQEDRAHEPTLGLARAATLAGIAPAPSVWNPINDPKQARVRELYVLNQMFIAGYITSQQAGRCVRRLLAARSLRRRSRMRRRSRRSSATWSRRSCSTTATRRCSTPAACGSRRRST